MSRLLWKIFYFYKRSVCLCLSNSLYQIKQSPSFHFSSTKFGLYSVQIHISWELLKVSGLKWFVQCWANKNTVSLDKKKKLNCGCLCRWAWSGKLVAFAFSCYVIFGWLVVMRLSWAGLWRSIMWDDFENLAGLLILCLVL